MELSILNETLKGVKNIKKASMMKEENIYKRVDGKFEKHPEWVIDTEGSNLIDVLKIDHINSNKTISNDVYEMDILL